MLTNDLFLYLVAVRDWFLTCFQKHTSMHAKIKFALQMVKIKERKLIHFEACLFWIKRINKPVSNWIPTCSLIQTGNYSLEHGLGLDHSSKLKPLTKTHRRNIIISIFLLLDKSKKKPRSQHAKDQVELTLKRSKVPSTYKKQELKFYQKKKQRQPSLCLKERRILYV